MSEPIRFHFDEGHLLLPAGYEDRTVNSFVPADPQTQPNLSIARDRFAAGETLPAYVARQLALMKRKLPGHKAAEPVGMALGAAGLPGLVVQATYRSGATTVHQRQAAVAISAERVLVFTMSSARAFDAAAETLWAGWLADLQLAPGA
jgi:hypothetical protein